MGSKPWIPLYGRCIDCLFFANFDYGKALRIEDNGATVSHLSYWPPEPLNGSVLRIGPVEFDVKVYVDPNIDASEMVSAWECIRQNYGVPLHEISPFLQEKEILEYLASGLLPSEPIQATLCRAVFLMKNVKTCRDFYRT